MGGEHANMSSHGLTRVYEGVKIQRVFCCAFHPQQGREASVRNQYASVLLSFKIYESQIPPQDRTATIHKVQEALQENLGLCELILDQMFTTHEWSWLEQLPQWPAKCRYPL